MWKKSKMRDHSLSSTWVVWALTREGPIHYCDNCSERMFVRFESGLCPLCFNGARELNQPPAQIAVPAERVLAGVLDDPAIEI